MFECDICGEEVTEEEMEPRFERARVGADDALVVHGHWQLASFNYGRRPAEELAQIQLEELAALGAPISEQDRAQYLADDLPDFENFEHWEFVFDAVNDAEMNLPAGYVALSSSDAGTWTLWALDRDAFERALATYEKGSQDAR